MNWKILLGLRGLFILLLLLLDWADALTDEERTAVLRAHNTFRGDLAAGKALNSDNQPLPTGQNIYRLVVDPSIEVIAQNWTNGCKFAHSSPQQRNNMGQNLYYTTARLPFHKALTDASASWWKELTDYGFNTSLVLTVEEFNKGIGHWSQMAWGRTARIGCGVTFCPGLFTLVVCNYSPAGNMLNSVVYEKGVACSQGSQCTTHENSECDLQYGLCSLN